MKRKLSGIFVFTILAFSQNMYGGFFSKTFNSRILSFLKTNRSTITVILCSSSIVGLMGVFCYRQNTQIGKQNTQIGKQNTQIDKQNTQIDELKNKNVLCEKGRKAFEEELGKRLCGKNKEYIQEKTKEIETRERKKMLKKTRGWLDLNSRCIADIGDLFSKESEMRKKYDVICEKHKNPVFLLNTHMEFDLTI